MIGFLNDYIHDFNTQSVCAQSIHAHLFGINDALIILNMLLYITVQSREVVEKDIFSLDIRIVYNTSCEMERSVFSAMFFASQL